MKLNTIATALCALGCVVVLTGCDSLSKSPADGLTFKAPNDYVSQMSILGTIQVWTKGTGADTQALMLFRSPVANPHHMSVDDALKSAKVDNGNVSDQKKITICGNQPAVLVHGKGTVGGTSGSTSHHDNLEMVLSQTDKPIMSMYSYPVGSAPDPNAEAAIMELCNAPAATST